MRLDGQAEAELLSLRNRHFKFREMRATAVRIYDREILRARYADAIKFLCRFDWLGGDGWQNRAVFAPFQDKGFLPGHANLVASHLLSRGFFPEAAGNNF